MIKGERSTFFNLFKFPRIVRELAVGLASLPFCEIFPQTQIDNARKLDKETSAILMELHNLFEEASDPKNPMYEKSRAIVLSLPDPTDPKKERDLDHEKKIHFRYQHFA